MWLPHMPSNASCELRSYKEPTIDTVSMGPISVVSIIAVLYRPPLCLFCDKVCGQVPFLEKKCYAKECSTSAFEELLLDKN